MRLCRARQRQSEPDASGEYSFGEHAKRLAGHLIECRPRANVMKEKRPHECQGSRRKARDLERRHGPGRLAEIHERAAVIEAVERACESIRADGIVDHLDTLASRQLAHALDEILPTVEDDVVGTALTCELAFLRSADGGDHAGTQVLCPADEVLPDRAGGRMNKERLAALNVIDVSQQHASRHAFHCKTRRRLVAYGCGEADGATGRQEARLGVSAVGLIDVDNAIAGHESLDGATDFLDDARGFEARDARGRKSAVEAGAYVGIVEIHPDGGVADAKLVRSGPAHSDF